MLKKIILSCGFALALLGTLAVEAAGLLAPGRAEASGLRIAPRSPFGFSDVILVQKGAGQFDGKWTITTSSQTCASKSGMNVLTIVNGAIIGGDPYPAKGSVSSSGAVRWSISALTDGTPLRFSGALRGNAGSGTYARADRKCSGSFAARRG